MHLLPFIGVPRARIRREAAAGEKIPKHLEAVSHKPDSGNPA